MSTTAKFGKVPWCDFLGEEVGCGFDRVEVLVGSPVDEAKHVHGTGGAGLGGELPAEGIGGKAELELGFACTLNWINTQ